MAIVEIDKPFAYVTNQNDIVQLPLLHIVFYLTTLMCPHNVTKLTISSGYGQKFTWVRQASGAWQATSENGKNAGLWSVDGFVISVTAKGQTAKTDVSQFVWRVPITGGIGTMESVMGQPVNIAFAGTLQNGKMTQNAVYFTIFPTRKDAIFAKQVVVAFSYK
jgi:hypothetical protein